MHGLRVGSGDRLAANVTFCCVFSSPAECHDWLNSALVVVWRCVDVCSYAARACNYLTNSRFSGTCPKGGPELLTIPSSIP
ncbi:hypothetical protein BaRGS_00002405 [Batillaria attramentaria]|uniref:Secreted protein n=1 Tax=Batillaria attramentaria TaxID=370345 RepID=A0ABD0M4H6_9CAEN